MAIDGIQIYVVSTAAVQGFQSLVCCGLSTEELIIIMHSCTTQTSLNLAKLKEMVDGT
jgi:hypothetical protein